MIIKFSYNYINMEKNIMEEVFWLLLKKKKYNILLMMKEQCYKLSFPFLLPIRLVVLMPMDHLQLLIWILLK